MSEDQIIVELSSVWDALSECERAVIIGIVDGQTAHPLTRVISKLMLPEMTVTEKRALISKVLHKEQREIIIFHGSFAVRVLVNSQETYGDFMKRLSKLFMIHGKSDFHIQVTNQQIQARIDQAKPDTLVWFMNLDKDQFVELMVL